MRLQIVEHDDRKGHSVMLGDRVLAKGDGAVCCQAARTLQAEGVGDAVVLEFARGDQIGLRGPLGAFAKLTIEQRLASDIRFASYTPFTKWPAARPGEPKDQFPG